MDSPATSPDPRTLQRNLFVAVWVGVFMWGVYLAVGAAWFNLDVRKGAVIFACSMIYLLAWLLVMKLRARYGQPAAGGAAGVTNRACGGALVLTAHGCGLMLLLASGILRLTRGPQGAVMLAIQILFGLGALAMIIGLSNPTRHRGKWMGWVALLLIVIGVVAGFAVPAAVTPEARQSGGHGWHAPTHRPILNTPRGVVESHAPTSWNYHQTRGVFERAEHS